VIYQCLAVIDVSRQVKAILQPLRRSDLAAARTALAQLGAADPSALGETEICRVGIERTARGCQERFLAPLFWAVLLGPAGALIHRATCVLAERSETGEGTPDGYARLSGRIDTVLSFLPARLLAVMSETFRKFRSFGKIRREAEKDPVPNSGWGKAALAYDLGVRLGQDPAVFNREGEPPTASHLAEALVWFWRVVCFATLLALIAV
jgi:adenosylcobinamide-phosphate synthase